MTDINKVPDADVIANRIFDVVKVHQLEQDMVSSILNDWNEEWIDFIAENETGKSDGTKRSNDKRLKDRIDRIGGPSPLTVINDPGF